MKVIIFFQVIPVSRRFKITFPKPIALHSTTMSFHILHKRCSTSERSRAAPENSLHVNLFSVKVMAESETSPFMVWNFSLSHFANCKEKKTYCERKKLIVSRSFFYLWTCPVCLSETTWVALQFVWNVFCGFLMFESPYILRKKRTKLIN